jgi:uncharacterized membrane protein
VALPYLLGAQSQVQGIRPNLFHPTDPAQLLWMFGLFLPGLVALVWCCYNEEPPEWRHIAVSVVVAVVMAATCLSIGAAWAGSTEAGRHWLMGFAATLTVREHLAAAAHRWQTGWVAPAALVVTVGLLSALTWRRLVGPRAAEPVQRNPARLFVLLIAGVGVALVAIPEVVYVADSFGTRMNTVFKLYYHAWLLLGIATAHGIFLAVRTRGWVAAYGVVGALVLLSGMTYLATGVYSRVAGGAVAPTLDALAYVGSVDPDELAAIHWMRNHTPPAARVIQGACASYRPDQCRLSVATGRATLLGWVGHELQWRGRAFTAQVAGRQAALEEIYTSTDPERLREVLRSWAVDYVYVGRPERAQFALTPTREASLQAVMELAFQSGDARIYRRRN